MKEKPVVKNNKKNGGQSKTFKVSTTITEDNYDLYYNYLHGTDSVTKNRKKAPQHLMLAAEEGDCRALYNLALAYHKGEMGPQMDKHKALELYYKAAEAGSPRACYDLSVILRDGELGPIRKEEGFKYLEKAAHSGFPQACYNLAYAYYNGDGVHKDDAVALKWYIRAADRGEELAMHALGFFYAHGIELVEKDLHKAARYFEMIGEEDEELFCMAQVALTLIYKALAEEILSFEGRLRGENEARALLKEARKSVRQGFYKKLDNAPFDDDVCANEVSLRKLLQVVLYEQLADIAKFRCEMKYGKEYWNKIRSIVLKNW